MAQTIKLKRSATQGATPTTSQLELGEVAINTYDGKMYIKKSVGGTESIVEITGGSGTTTTAADAILIEYQYTATSSQTTFSGSDDNSETLSYTADAIQVFLNGVLLDPAIDYTATNGTSVVLSAATTTGDYLQIFAFKKRIADGNVSVDTFTGNNSTTAFTLSVNPGDENNTRVFIDGVYQSKSNYSVSGTTLTFSTAPPTDTAIEVEIGNRAVTLDTASSINLLDNSKLQLGTSQDLEVFHNGTDSVINQTGTGDLLIQKDETTVAEFDVDGLTVTGDVEVTGEVIGDLRGATLFKAQAGESLAKGEVVYISGVSGNTTVVSKADADDTSKMPAFGLVSAAASSGNPVDIYTAGIIADIDTSAYSEGDELFVSTTAGALTATAPTGESSALQKIGKVTRSDATGGRIFIIGAGRSNAVPNLDDGDIFIGNASNQAVSASLNTKIEDYLDGGTSTPTFAGLTTTADVSFGDNDKAIFGVGSDLQIYHDSSDSYIVDSGTGNLKIQADDLVFKTADGVKEYLKGTADGSVRIRHNGNTKFETTSTGIDVTGSVVSDGLTVDASTAVVQASNAGGTTSFEISNTDGVSTLYNKATLYLSATGAEANAAKIESQFTGTVATNHAQELKFYTVNTGSTPVERMKISSGGDVIVGTSAVTGGRYLDIYNTGSTATDFAITRFITQQVGSSSTTSADIIKRKNGQFGFINNDTNSAAYINFTVGTSERMRVDSSGNVGIGTSSTFGKLSINSNGAPASSGNMTTGLTVHNGTGGTAINIGTNDSGAYNYIQSGYVNNANVARNLAFFSGATRAVDIDTSGNIGIGTSSPGRKLHLKDGQIKFQSTASGGWAGLDFSMGNGTYDGYMGMLDSDGKFFIDVDSNGNDFVILQNGNVGIGTSSPLTICELEDTQAQLTIDSTGSSYSRVVHQHNGTSLWTTGTRAASDYHIYRESGSGNVIVDAGNVGIGTQSPGVKLDVAGTTDPTIRVLSSGTGASDDTILRSQIGGTTASNYLYFGDADDNNSGQMRYVHSDDSMRFYAGATTERFRLYSTATIFYNGTTEIGRFHSNNKFGIGTSSPTMNLHVHSTGNTLAKISSSFNGSTTTGLYIDSTGDTSKARLAFQKGGSTVGVLGFNHASSAASEGYSFSTSLGVRALLQGDGLRLYNTSGGVSHHFTYNENGGEIQLLDENGSVGTLIDEVSSASRFLQLVNGSVVQVGLGSSNTTGNIQFIGGGSEWARFTSAGNFLVGKSSTNVGVAGVEFRAGSSNYMVTSNDTVLGLNRLSSVGTIQEFRKDTTVVGTISVTASATAYNTSSDQRLKDNIVDAPSASDDIDAIQVRSFDWKADGVHQKYGMVAQELNTVAPDAVTEGETEEDMMSVDYSKLVPMLVKALQESRQEINNLKSRVEELESQ